MSKRKQIDYYACDFETTVYKGQKSTEVWAGACVKLHTEKVNIFGSIGSMFNWVLSLEKDSVLYFHNLKFDGSFWLDFLLRQKEWKSAFNESTQSFPNKDDMEVNTYMYTISNRGMWYSIYLKTKKALIEIRDSLKLIPFSIKAIGKAFGTKHRKLEMEYVGKRYAGCEITEEEKKYIENDVLVLKEAMEIMHSEGHNGMTIGSCCMKTFKNTRGAFTDVPYEVMFPDLTEETVETDDLGEITVDKWIRKSYKGGWCYVVSGKENKMFYDGVTADVNSLYPSMMHSESGNEYPVGEPHYWKGADFPKQVFQPHKMYFLRFRCNFYLKDGYLPFVQIKDNLMYDATECLETSDAWDVKEEKMVKNPVVLTMTQMDYELFLEHYEVEDLEIIDGIWFSTEMGIFDEYINFFRKMKIDAEKEGNKGRRTLAKLFLNNLYGKMASSTESSFKIAYIDDKNKVNFRNITANQKKAGYIPIGSSITSYARCFTIRSAQANYYGKDKRGFIYADTDSIHCDLKPEEVKGIKVHDTNFCCWKLESTWDKGYFVRQKTYIEHVVAEDLKPVDPYYNVKCAGMPQRCKDLLIQSFDLHEKLENTKPNEIEILKKEFAEKLQKEGRTPVEVDFVMKVLTIEDFGVGIIVPSKLMPRRMEGGIVLTETTFEMR